MPCRVLVLWLVGAKLWSGKPAQARRLAEFGIKNRAFQGLQTHGAGGMAAIGDDEADGEIVTPSAQDLARYEPLGGAPLWISLCPRDPAPRGKPVLEAR